MKSWVSDQFTLSTGIHLSILAHVESLNHSVVSIINTSFVSHPSSKLAIKLSNASPYLGSRTIKCPSPMRCFFGSDFDERAIFCSTAPNAIEVFRVLDEG